MIYTVTFNPSMDYIVSMDAFKTGRTNRTREEQLLPGGKGINVSIVLKNLGIQSTALGFIAGFTGEEIEKRLTRMGIATGFLPLADGCSRINVKFKQMDGTEINGRGPEIPSQKERELTDRLAALKEGDVLFLSGSIPSSMPDDTYQKIMERLDGTGVRVVVDATKELLLKVLPHRPFLIKPNHHELGEIFGVTLRTREAALPYAKRLKEQGAENVLVSMGGAERFWLPQTAVFMRLLRQRERLSAVSEPAIPWSPGLWPVSWSGMTMNMPFTWDLRPGAQAHFRSIWPQEKRWRPFTGRSCREKRNNFVDMETKLG